MFKIKKFHLQVKSGTIFDNILITDDPDFAKEFGESTWGKTKVLKNILHLKKKNWLKYIWCWYRNLAEKI